MLTQIDIGQLPQLRNCVKMRFLTTSMTVIVSGSAGLADGRNSMQ
jgi:hypothetical protein